MHLVVAMVAAETVAERVAAAGAVAWVEVAKEAAMAVAEKAVV